MRDDGKFCSFMGVRWKSEKRNELNKFVIFIVMKRDNLMGREINLFIYLFLKFLKWKEKK